MSDHFDPYYTWLGIPPEEQPADLYRLLGVRQFEANEEVIVNASDQRMAYLRTFQVGKRSKESQQLLNEISTAQGCLLHPKKKQAYDEQLRRKLATSQPAAPVQPMAVQPARGQPAPVQPLPARPVAAALPQATPLPARPAMARARTPQAAPQIAARPTAAPQPAPLNVDPLGSLQASARPLRPVVAPKPGLPVSLPVLISGGSLAVGILLLLGVVVWAVTRPSRPATVAAAQLPLTPTPRPQLAENRGGPPAPPPPAPSPPASPGNESPLAAPPAVVVSETPTPEVAASPAAAAPPPMTDVGGAEGGVVLRPGMVLAAVPFGANADNSLVLHPQEKFFASVVRGRRNHALTTLRLDPFEGYAGQAAGLAFSPNGELFAEYAASDNGTDVSIRRCNSSLEGLVRFDCPSRVHSVAFSANGRFVFAAHEGSPKLVTYDIVMRSTLPFLETDLPDVAWLNLAGEYLVCWSFTGKVQVFSGIAGRGRTATSESRILTNTSRFAPLGSCLDDAAGPILVTAEPPELIRWELKSGIHVSRCIVRGLSSPADVLAVSRNCQLVAVRRDGGLSLLRLPEGQELTRIDWPEGRFFAAGISASDGLLILNGPQTRAIVLDLPQLLAAPRWRMPSESEWGRLGFGKLPLQLSPDGAGASGAPLVRATNAPTSPPIERAATPPQTREGGRAAVAALKAAGVQVADDPEQVYVLPLGQARLTEAQAVLLAQLPNLQSIDLRGSPQAAELLKQFPTFSRVGTLILSQAPIGDDNLAALQKFPALTFLELQETQVKGPGLENLKHVPLLEFLHLPAGIPPAAAAPVFKLPNLKRCENLPLGPFSDDDLVVFSRLTKLEALNLRNTNVDGSGLVHLKSCTFLGHLDLPETVKSGHLVHLKNLPLSYFHFGDQMGDEALPHLANKPTLKMVWLPDISDAGMEIVGQFTNVETLFMSRSRRVTAAGFAHLQKLQQLKTVDLSPDTPADAIPVIAGIPNLESASLRTQEFVTDEHLKPFIKARALKTLMLGRGITDTGLQYVAQMAKLEQLNLHGSRVTAKGIGELRKLPTLQRLYFYEVVLDDDAVAALAQCSQLQRIGVRSALNPAQLQRLKRALPKCQIEG